VEPVDLIVGTATAIGTIVGSVTLALKKMNLISFGKPKEAMKTQNSSRECPAHKDIVKQQAEISKELSEIHDVQVRNCELHKQHDSNLRNHKAEFKCLKESLNNIARMIAVLKDRSDREYRSK